MNWNIIVVDKNPFATNKTWFVSHGDIKTLMEALCRAFPGQAVLLRGMARIRLSMKDGKVVSDIPNLDHFYSGTTSQEEHDWEHML